MERNHGSRCQWMMCRHQAVKIVMSAVHMPRNSFSPYFLTKILWILGTSCLVLYVVVISRVQFWTRPTAFSFFFFLLIYFTNSMLKWVWTYNRQGNEWTTTEGNNLDICDKNDKELGLGRGSYQPQSTTHIEQHQGRAASPFFCQFLWLPKI